MWVQSPVFVLVFVLVFGLVKLPAMATTTPTSFSCHPTLRSLRCRILHVDMSPIPKSRLQHNYNHLSIYLPTYLPMGQSLLWNHRFQFHIDHPITGVPKCHPYPPLSYLSVYLPTDPSTHPPIHDKSIVCLITNVYIYIYRYRYMMRKQ